MMFQSQLIKSILRISNKRVEKYLSILFLEQKKATKRYEKGEKSAKNTSKTQKNRKRKERARVFVISLARARARVCVSLLLCVELCARS